MYQSKNAPKYTLGHAWSLGVLLMAMILFTIVYFVYGRRNKEKGSARAAGTVVPEGEWTDRAPDFRYQT